ncbi:hypothetical protein RO3G_14942 [Rhizopus delemar RA 99-880]|uniref:Uncharacterized protein n=1 Tax=Rhizopus delemar (strain RA 99-880 / ATCC MYA-4621 / FGSC 9543 / NRRL 43880) TaxID=246409 RepID=I1CP51_RHIO9|nr:hypothetical protein RO3G_14942 [Rhizopus delemar RA 99-880]|eukprot:EIE90231.1 hypothetical protein RO3G_14942 [Rhizopus delemar RA 99-880]
MADMFWAGAFSIKFYALIRTCAQAVLRYLEGGHDHPDHFFLYAGLCVIHQERDEVALSKRKREEDE